MPDFTKEFKEVKILPAVFWYIFTMFIVVIIALVIGNKYVISDDNFLTLISSALFICILLYKFRVSKHKIYLLIKDYLEKINYKELFGVVATQLCLSMGISLLVIAIVYFNVPNLLTGLLEDSPVSNYSTYSGMLTAMLITVVCAPISEEILFRAVIFKRTSRKFNVYIGMIVSSLIFGLLHIELAIIGAFLFGIACCVLYIKYKNILIPMTVHFLNNLMAFLPQFGSSSSNENVLFTETDARLYLIMGSILFIIGMFFFIKFLIRNKCYLKAGFAPRIENSTSNNL